MNIGLFKNITEKSMNGNNFKFIFDYYGNMIFGIFCFYNL